MRFDGGGEMSVPWGDLVQLGLRLLWTAGLHRVLFHPGDDGAARFAESGQVFGFLVNGVVLPATPQDPNPFVGQGAHGGVMAHALGAFHLVESQRPAAEEATLGGPFMEALLEELRTSVATVDLSLLTALFGDGGDATGTLQVGGSSIAFALGAKTR